LIERRRAPSPCGIGARNATLSPRPRVNDDPARRHGPFGQGMVKSATGGGYLSSEVGRMVGTARPFPPPQVEGARLGKPHPASPPGSRCSVVPGDVRPDPLRRGSWVCDCAHGEGASQVQGAWRATSDSAPVGPDLSTSTTAARHATARFPRDSHHRLNGRWAPGMAGWDRSATAGHLAPLRWPAVPLRSLGSGPVRCGRLSIPCIYE
jgi:hypothetical protein